MIIQELCQLNRDRILERTKPSSHRATKVHCELWGRVFGERALDEVSRQDVLGWATQRRTERADATVIREISFLHQAFELALELGLVATNPAAKPQLKLRGAKRHQWLTYEQQPALMQGYFSSMPGRGELKWSVADFVLLTGLRLQFAALDQARCPPEVRHQLIEHNAGGGSSGDRRRCQAETGRKPGRRLLGTIGDGFHGFLVDMG